MKKQLAGICDEFYPEHLDKAQIFGQKSIINQDSLDKEDL